MTLVVAKRFGDAIVIVSDTQLTADKRKPRLPRLNGAIRSMVMAPGLTISYAGDPDIANQALLANVGLHGHPTYSRVQGRAPQVRAGDGFHIGLSSSDTARGDQGRSRGGRRNIGVDRMLRGVRSIQGEFHTEKSSTNLPEIVKVGSDILPRFYLSPGDLLQVGEQFLVALPLAACVLRADGGPQAQVM
jgi:hypothetical protein